MVDKDGDKQPVKVVKARSSSDIRRYILHIAHKKEKNLVKTVSEKYGISRQAVSKHVKFLLNNGLLEATGATRNRIYSLKSLLEKTITVYLENQLQEDVVWQDNIAELLRGLPPNVLSIWLYGFTEMLNNVIDHSNGRVAIIQVKQTGLMTEMAIWDDGEGIFKKIRREMGLLDERHAVLELSKGKLTTDPDHHTGEGIFFTSRIFDSFSIVSGDVYFSHKHDEDEDWVLENTERQGATGVFMEIDNRSTRTVEEVFEDFAAEEGDYQFNKTVVPVRLAKYGDEQLVSRSQAKRLLARVEKFKVVLLDFIEVNEIGVAFADEIFRVFPLHHPDIAIHPIHACEDVQKIIDRTKPQPPPRTLRTDS